MIFGYFVLGLIVVIVLASIKQVNQYEKGVKFRFGKYVEMMQPGWRLVFPIIESWRNIDLRVKTVDVPSQECVSKDNISIKVNAVLYYKVVQAEKAVMEVEHFMYAVSQLAQTTMRNIVGEFELDEILSQRDEISNKIQTIVDKETDPWGVKVTRIELKDIEIPDDMKRTIAKVAEAVRERKAIILKAEGETIASKNLSKAAQELGKNPGALHLRTLQTLNDLSSDKSNTVIIGIPLEILRAYEKMKK
ncbi:slipin family protein [Candidatus Woesearchaeota archaeon]|nr:slipin family protein [Candidatus Woesearchaeota archaeon]